MTLASSNEKNTRPTAGPWRVEDVGIPGTLAIMAGSTTEYRWIATVTEDMGSGVDWMQTQANAQLIAASPCMYDYIAKQAGNGDAEAAAILESVHKSPASAITDIVGCAGDPGCFLPDGHHGDHSPASPRSREP